MEQLRSLLAPLATVCYLRLALYSKHDKMCIQGVIIYTHNLHLQIITVREL